VMELMERSDRSRKEFCCFHCVCFFFFSGREEGKVELFGEVSGGGEG
jgi:hypothetical protein